MKLLDFLLLLLLVFLVAPAQHHARVQPERARPLVRVLRSPQAPKIVRRVGALPAKQRLPLPSGAEPPKENSSTHL